MVSCFLFPGKSTREVWLHICMLSVVLINASSARPHRTKRPKFFSPCVYLQFKTGSSLKADRTSWITWSRQDCSLSACIFTLLLDIHIFLCDHHICMWLIKKFYFPYCRSTEATLQVNSVSYMSHKCYPQLPGSGVSQDTTTEFLTVERAIHLR